MSVNKTNTRNGEAEWQGSTDGFPWMLKALIFILKYVNVRVIYAAMSVVVVFYMIINRKNYLAIKSFYRDKLGYKGFALFKITYLDHFSFGQVIIDKFAYYAGKRCDIEIVNNNIFMELSESECGFMMLSSHVGNDEIAGFTLKSDLKKVFALVYGGEKAEVMMNRAVLLNGNNVELVPVSADMSHLFVLNNALADGHIVNMTGDRTFGSQKKISCEFFGSPANFPLGPFALAVQRNVPVISVFVMKTGATKYKIYVNRVDNEELVGSSREKMQKLARMFAVQLESVVREYPTQWFNFYDFWK